MKKDLILIKNWTHLQEVLFSEAWNQQLGRYRSPYAYRGISIDDGTIESSLMNLGGNYLKMEKHLLRNFRKYAHKDVVETDSLWNWLSLAKHHGLPTRLVDWSFSPLVALHFVTQYEIDYDKDGVVWMANYSEIHKVLPSKLRDALKDEGSDVFTVDILSEQFPSLTEFDNLSKENFLLFFEPPSMDERIINQFALFSAVSNASMPVNKWLEKHPGTYKRIIIPAKLKLEIRDKLDQMNITERVLFPGLDGLSRWLKRQYSSFE